jgi:hypothetical protein
MSKEAAFDMNESTYMKSDEYKDTCLEEVVQKMKMAIAPEPLDLRHDNLQSVFGKLHNYEFVSHLSDYELIEHYGGCAVEKAIIERIKEHDFCLPIQCRTHDTFMDIQYNSFRVGKYKTESFVLGKVINVHNTRHHTAYDITSFHDDFYKTADGRKSFRDHVTHIADVISDQLKKDATEDLNNFKIKHQVSGIGFIFIDNFSDNCAKRSNMKLVHERYNGFHLEGFLYTKSIIYKELHTAPSDSTIISQAQTEN